MGIGDHRDGQSLGGVRIRDQHGRGAARDRVGDEVRAVGAAAGERREEIAVSRRAQVGGEAANIGIAPGPCQN